MHALTHLLGHICTAVYCHSWTRGSECGPAERDGLEWAGWTDTIDSTGRNGTMDDTADMMDMTARIARGGIAQNGIEWRGHEREEQTDPSSHDPTRGARSIDGRNPLPIESNDGIEE